MTAKGVPILKCVVCGDRANGYNFNVLSCESCKAFFRRNVSKQSKLECIFKGNCEIDTKNRKLCRYCRLKKCFTSGMRKELMLTEEQKKVRKIYIENNKIRKNSRKQNKDIEVTSDYESAYESTGSVSEPFVDSDSNSPINEFYDVVINDVQELSEEVSDINSLSEDSDDGQQIQSELALVPISRPITDYRNNLTEVEGNYLTELLSAAKTLRAPIGAITSEANCFTVAIHVMLSARFSDANNYVLMCKGLTAFKSIDQYDRHGIVRPGSIEISFMRNVAGYFNDNDKEYFIIPTDSEKSCTCLIDLEVFRTSKPEYYWAHRNFYRKISQEWDSDQIILDLLTAIVLFNPERKCIRDRHTIRDQQNIYKYLLQRYLLLKYRTESEAKLKYSRLMTAIEYLHILLDKNRQTILEENLLDKKMCKTLWSGLDF